MAPLAQSSAETGEKPALSKAEAKEFLLADLDKILPVDAGEDIRLQRNVLFDRFVSETGKEEAAGLDLDDLKKGLTTVFGSVFTAQVMGKGWVNSMIAAAFNAARVKFSATDEEMATVNRQEFRYFLRQLKYTVQLRQIFRKIDADKDKKLSIDEFQNALVQLLPGAEKWIKHIHVIFGLFDYDHDGHVDLKEFVALLMPKLLAHAVHDPEAKVDAKEWLKEQGLSGFAMTGEAGETEEEATMTSSPSRGASFRRTPSRGGSARMPSKEFSTKTFQQAATLSLTGTMGRTPSRPSTSTGRQTSETPTAGISKQCELDMRRSDGDSLSSEVIAAIRSRASDECENCKLSGRVGNAGTGCIGNWCRWQRKSLLVDGVGARLGRESSSTPGPLHYSGWQRCAQASYPVGSSFGIAPTIGPKGCKCLDCRRAVLDKTFKESSRPRVDWIKVAKRLPTGEGQEKDRAEFFQRCDPSASKLLSLAKVEYGLRTFIGQSMRFCTPAVHRAFHAARGISPSSDVGSSNDWYVEESEFWYFLVYLKFYLMTWQCFQLIDSESDNRITWTEFRTACHKLGKWGVKLVTADPTDEQYNQEVRVVWDFMDHDDSGMVLFAEFADLCLRRFLRNPDHCGFSHEESHQALEVLLHRDPNLYGAFDIGADKRGSVDAKKGMVADGKRGSNPSSPKHGTEKRGSFEREGKR
mmetsp:Transcript_26570/g.62082  ORF Transcript_26570/g.62082 Transcript_26570/m.62082 type:complete len:695 (-) Transcript_26570:53-2137(-)